MSARIQKCFTTLPGGFSDIQPRIILEACEALPPAMTSVCESHTYFRHDLFCSSTKLSVENATLRSELVRLKNFLEAKNEQLLEERNVVLCLQEDLETSERNRKNSEEDHRLQLAQEAELLSACRHDLHVSRENYNILCVQQKSTKEEYETLVAKEELSRAEHHRKLEELSATLLQKNTEITLTGKKFSEALAEKTNIEENYRLFKNTVLNDLAKEGDETGDGSLMIKIRLLQESNAELSAEVKSLSRKLATAEVDQAAVKEELSLSDRMRNRLSSNVGVQSIEIEGLEKKLKYNCDLLAQEQITLQGVKEENKVLELQLIQSKFTIERMENVISDLKETNDSLEKSNAEQVSENKRWMDRMKNVERTNQNDLENRLRELDVKFERDLAFERDRLKEKDKECIETLSSLKSMSSLMDATLKESSDQKSRIAVLEQELARHSDIEAIVSDMQADLDEKEVEIATLCQAFEKRGDTMKELEKRISLQASEISFLRPERDTKAKMAKEYEEQLCILRNEKAELLRVSSQNDNRGGVIDDLKMSIVHYEQKLKDIVDDKNSLKDANAELDRLKTEHRALKDDYEEAEDTMVELSRTAADEIQQREKQVVSLRALLHEKQEESAALQKKFTSLQKKNKELEAFIENAKSSSIFG